MLNQSLIIKLYIFDLNEQLLYENSYLIISNSYPFL